MATVELGGLSEKVVFHDWDGKHDFDSGSKKTDSLGLIRQVQLYFSKSVSRGASDLIAPQPQTYKIYRVQDLNMRCVPNWLTPYILTT